MTSKVFVSLLFSLGALPTPHMHFTITDRLCQQHDVWYWVQSIGFYNATVVIMAQLCTSISIPRLVTCIKSLSNARTNLNMSYYPWHSCRCSYPMGPGRMWGFPVREESKDTVRGKDGSLRSPTGRPRLHIRRRVRRGEAAATVRPPCAPRLAPIAPTAQRPPPSALRGLSAGTLRLRRVSQLSTPRTVPGFGPPDSRIPDAKCNPSCTCNHSHELGASTKGPLYEELHTGPSVGDGRPERTRRHSAGFGGTDGLRQEQKQRKILRRLMKEFLFSSPAVFPP